MLRQSLGCKDPHEDICAEIAAAQKQLASDQLVLQLYQDMVDKINRGEFNGTFVEAQNAILAGVRRRQQAMGHTPTAHVGGSTTWEPSLGRPTITITPPARGTTGCTAIGLLGG